MLHKWRVMNICVGYNDTLIHTGASIALIKWYVSDRGLLVISTTELVVPGLHWATREMCLVMKNGFEMFMKTLENNDGIKYGIYIMLKRSHSHSYLTAMWHYVCCTSLFLCVSVSLSFLSLSVPYSSLCVCSMSTHALLLPAIRKKKVFLWNWWASFCLKIEIKCNVPVWCWRLGCVMETHLAQQCRNQWKTYCGFNASTYLVCLFLPLL